MRGLAIQALDECHPVSRDHLLPPQKEAALTGSLAPRKQPGLNLIAATLEHKGANRLKVGILQEYYMSIMVCKLQLHSVSPVSQTGSNKELLTGAAVRMGAVWEGTTEKQQASENSLFGHFTPCAEFVATILNQRVVDKLVQGKKYYVTFSEAPD